MTRQAMFPVPEPDPKAMYLRQEHGAIAAGRYEGSAFGLTGSGLYIDVRYDGERLGTVVIPATVWVGAIIDALDGEPTEPTQYTLAQAAGKLGVSPSTLRNQVNAGRIAATKVGTVWTISSAELERYRSESLGQRKGGKA